MKNAYLQAFILTLLTSALANVFAAPGSETGISPSRSDSNVSNSMVMEGESEENGRSGAGAGFGSETPGGLGLEDSQEAREARRVVFAFARAYPDKISETAYRDGDWALRIGDQWFYYADRKMLPSEAREEQERYSRYSFYEYEKELPEIREFTEEQIASMEERVVDRATSGIGRHPGLTDALWNINDAVSADAAAKTMYLFGARVNVHRDLMEDLARVESRIREKAAEDPQLRRFINSIVNIDGQFWRSIAGSSNRSNHAYGIAIDIPPARYDRSQVYWRWAREAGLPWYSLPYDQRHMPPMSFVQAFEEEGFIWGGKWFYFDTIHFEYRPEILVYSGWELEKFSP